MHDVVIIGAGHNGLVAAALLAKAGLRTLVLERAETVGGCATTTEIAPGYRCPTLAHAAAIDPAIIRTLGLERHGLEIIAPDARVCAPTTDGRALVIWSDPARTAREIAAFSPADADRYPRFLATFAQVTGVLRALHASPAPSIDHPTAGDLIALLKAGRKFRTLNDRDAYSLLRWMPMTVADVVGESFDSEPLRATIAAGGVFGTFAGPWSAGTGAVLLALCAGEGHPAGGGWSARGGPGAIGAALTAAARQAGVEVRTGAEVASVHIKDGTATGVLLHNGDEIPARAVVSNADPKRTLLGLVDPIHFRSDFLRRVRNVRMTAALAKVNFAVSSLPRFASLRGLDASQQAAALAGRVRLNPSIEHIERAFDAAKYGGFADEPWIELAIPSISDPSLAPADRHVVSAYVQFAPFDLRDTTWEAQRDRLGAVTTRTIEQYAPGFESSIVARQVITPLDLEQTYGLTGGQIFHGDLALDQYLVTRPFLGWARYETPIRNLFLCGSGTHPGTGLDGRSGMLAAKVIERAMKDRRV